MSVYMCIRKLFSLPNHWTIQAVIWHVISKYLGEHYQLNVGVVMGVVLS